VIVIVTVCDSNSENETKAMEAEKDSIISWFAKP
jgi:hypothetical protein